MAASIIGVSSLYHQLPIKPTTLSPSSFTSHNKPHLISLPTKLTHHIASSSSSFVASAVSARNSVITEDVFVGLSLFDDDDNNNNNNNNNKDSSLEEFDNDVINGGVDELAVSKLGLPQRLVETLENRGITNLFPIQRAVLVPALEGRDIIGRAKTGTGKTLAFAIPIIKRVTEEDEENRNRLAGRLPRVLVLAPTRELAKQVETEIKESAPYLRTVCVYGGVSYTLQKNQLTRGVDIVVGTPGRLIDLVNSNVLKLGEVQFLVLDEADQMLAVGFEEDVETILEKLPPQRQSMLFSATMPRWVQKLSRKYLKTPLTIDLVGDQDEKLAEGIKLYAIPTTSTTKRSILGDLVTVYAKGGKTIIFTQTKRDADEVSMALTSSIASEALHGDISQHQRERTLNGFRQGKFTVLVATDVASRGLDIPNVDLNLSKLLEETRRNMKGRKSPRILRIKARSYSNVKSNPIVCDNEHSENDEETDTELSLSTDRANTLSRMDAEIERQLEESRQKKLKKKEERNKMVKESRTKKLHESTIIREVFQTKAIKSGKEDNKKQMVKKSGKEDNKKQMVKKVKEKQPKKLQLVATCEGARKRKNEGVEAKKATNTKKQKTNEGTKKGRKKQAAKSTKKEAQKPQREPLLYSLRTRASPRKLYECLWSLNERQKEIVKDMGFGKLLSMVVNGIPGKLGYFVVDNFNPETMEIKFGRLSIKVDEESIHQLLGVPNSGIDLTNFEVPKDTTPLGMAFKTRHGNKLTISTSTILNKITMGKDNEGFMFKVDFIVLFMNTMVECHINGLCKTGIVDILNEQMDFSKINWCKYIVNIIKRCKTKWVPRDFSSFFRGALTTLTLLYVDSVTCKGINEARTVNPLKFWTMQRLQLREDMELENGGFGRGDFRGLFVDESSSDDDTSEESEEEVDEDEESELEEPETKSLEMHFREIGTYYYWLERNKANFEKSIAEIQSKFPEKESVEIFVEQYKEKFRKLFNQSEAEIEQATEKHCLDLIVQSMDVLKESEAATPKTKGDIDEEDGKSEAPQLLSSQPTFSLGISGIGDQLEEENNGVDAEMQQSKEAPQLLSSQPTFSLGISGIGDQLEEKNNGVDSKTQQSKEAPQLLSSQPSFSLGISGIGDQLEEKNNGVDAQTQQSKEAPELLSSQPSFSLGISGIDERPQRMKHPTYASKSPFIIREVDICKQLTKDEVRIWNYLMESSNGQLFQEDRPEYEGKSDEKKDTCMQSKEAKEIQTDFEDDVFETISGHTTKRFLLRSLKPGETVLNNVIDCWAAILNHDEELRGPESDKRLFCDTSVMSEDMLTNGKMDEAARLEVIETSLKGVLKGTNYEANLKNVELVLIPILEKGHYYLICFDLQNLAIEVIDNIDESKSFVGLQDNEKYSKKDTVLKVKHMFIVYLKSVGNAKWEDLEAVVPVKRKLTWATKKNSIDCGVFLMRHMETFKVSCSKNWECGIKTEKSKKQKQQLNLLRKKYAAKIVLSKANIHRQSVIDKAVKFEKENNESTKCDPK